MKSKWDKNNNFRPANLSFDVLVENINNWRIQLQFFTHFCVKCSTYTTSQVCVSPSFYVIQITCKSFEKVAKLHRIYQVDANVCLQGVPVLGWPAITTDENFTNFLIIRSSTFQICLRLRVWGNVYTRDDICFNELFSSWLANPNRYFLYVYLKTVLFSYQKIGLINLHRFVAALNVNV